MSHGDCLTVFNIVCFSPNENCARIQLTRYTVSNITFNTILIAILREKHCFRICITRIAGQRAVGSVSARRRFVRIGRLRFSHRHRPRCADQVWCGRRAIVVVLFDHPCSLNISIVVAHWLRRLSSACLLVSSLGTFVGANAVEHVHTTMFEFRSTICYVNFTESQPNYKALRRC
jgi:hypothetical protein